MKIKYLSAAIFAIGAGFIFSQIKVHKPQPKIDVVSKGAPQSFSVKLASNQNVSFGSNFDLTAQIESQIPVDQLTIHWKVPRNITLVGGKLSETFGPVSPGRPIIKRITLRVPDTANYQIYAEVFREQSDRRQVAVAQFNTNTEKLDKKFQVSEVMVAPQFQKAANGPLGPSSQIGGPVHPPKIQQ